MQHGGLWRTVRGRAHVIFPVLAVAVVALVLTSPFYGGPLSFLSSNAFARFCMFWCLGASTVLSFANRNPRPSVVAAMAVAIALVVCAAFCLIYVGVFGDLDLSTFVLSCLAGAILGSLAGTWLIYVLEVYVGR